MEPTGSEEVKIPELAPNGRNWKIYRVKIIEAAATDITDPLGVLAGWQPDDGSYNWECLDAILKWTFYTTVPISILRPIRKLDTAHEVFNYLVKHFRDPNPIVDPRATSANEAKHGMDENSQAEQRESPMSENAATEWHADAETDEKDLPNTQDLPNRGTESVNSWNVGREDLHTSAEASVTGRSTECIDMTKGVLHGTRNKSQKLRTTSRLPTDGEPSECEQEAAESVVTAGHTSGVLEMVEMIVDVNRMALLGGDLAERVHIVGEGDGTECRDLQLQETELLCEESHQHSGNANANVPSAYGVLLEGEWAVCVSGESGCGGGASGFASVDEADGDIG